MSAELIDVFQGIITIEIDGHLTPQEFAAVHEATARELVALGGAKILVLAGNFTGWSEGGGWEDLSFQTANDPLIQRMALVMDPGWEKLAQLFTAKGLRPFPIECFPPSQEAEARAWLNS
jgi:hypothetical protein